jgi:hypothetical protein
MTVHISRAHSEEHVYNSVTHLQGVRQQNTLTAVSRIQTLTIPKLWHLSHGGRRRLGRSSEGPLQRHTSAVMNIDNDDCDDDDDDDDDTKLHSFHTRRTATEVKFCTPAEGHCEVQSLGWPRTGSVCPSREYAPLWIPPWP